MMMVKYGRDSKGYERAAVCVIKVQRAGHGGCMQTVH